MSEDNDEQPVKNKGGRPPSTRKLLDKIKKLESELNATKLAKVDEVVTEEDLTMKAYCAIHDEEKREYKLITVSFDLETGLGKVTEVKFLSDSYAKYIFEMKKLLANNVFLQEK